MKYPNDLTKLNPLVGACGRVCARVLLNKNIKRGAFVGYRKLKGVPLPEVRQGLIYFTCRNFDHQSKQRKQKITELCTVVAGPHSDALLELLKTDRSTQAIAMKYYIDHSHLCRYRRDFYIEFDKYLKSQNR